MSNVLVKLHALAIARRTYAQVKAQREASLREWEEANADLINNCSMAGAIVLDAEKSVREAAIVEYRASGKKTIAPGLGVREKTTTVYTYVPAEALAWAKKHDLALMLDTKALEGIAKAAPEIVPFVSIHKEVTPEPTIAADLDRVLPAPEPAG